MSNEVVPLSTTHTPDQLGQATLRETSEVLAGLTANGVVVNADADLLEYLSNHSDLGSLLPTITGRVRQEFGSGAEVSLELYKDPEIQDRHLVLLVRQRKYETGMLDRLEAVSSLFASQLEASSGYLLITTDFRCPRR